MMVIHNLIRDDEIVDPHKQWARITRPLGTTSPPVIYTIEPLEALLQHIRTFCEWVYDE